MPCVAWFREQLIKEGGGESKIAGMAREQLKVFTDKYGEVWEEDETVLSTVAGTVPITPEDMADATNRISQAAMAGVVSKHMRREWLQRASALEKARDIAQKNGEWQVPVMCVPITDEVTLDDRAVTGHLRHCLMIPEKLPDIPCACGRARLSRSHVLSCSRGDISQSVHQHDRSRDLVARMARRCGLYAVMEPRKITLQSNGFEGGPDIKLSGMQMVAEGDSSVALIDVTYPVAENPTNIPTMMKATKPGAVAKAAELKKYKDREYAYVAARNGFQFYGAAMEKESLAQGQGFYELLKRIAAHRHGEDFNADIDNQYSYSRVGLWCAKTAWAYWRQALMVEFVNNREKVISEAVAKAVDRSEDGVHNAWQHGM